MTQRKYLLLLFTEGQNEFQKIRYRALKFWRWGPGHAHGLLVASSGRAAFTFGPVACEGKSGGNRLGPARCASRPKTFSNKSSLIRTQCCFPQRTVKNISMMYVALTLQLYLYSSTLFFLSVTLNRDAFTDFKLKWRYSIHVFGSYWLVVHNYECEMNVSSQSLLL